jgi:hypothetical protein
MSGIKPSLWRAGNDLATAAYVLENIHALFAAIAKQSEGNTAILARIGKGIAEEWSDTLGEGSEAFFHESKVLGQQSRGAQ